jgi:release factor glutamine methyltransferase
MLPGMLSVLEIIQKTTGFFESKGIENPRFNAETLIGYALGLKRMALYMQFERLLSDAELDKIRPFVRRRSLREPLAYVLGSVDFHGLHLKADKRALIPRPETEELVELILARLKSDGLSPKRILDLGTGSGCIALALAAHLSEARVLALDASAEALSLAAENAKACGLDERVTFRKSDWYSALDPAEERFDLIVSNPPYLTPEETAQTQPEVQQHEPLSALSAGDEGAADLLAIIEGAAARLNPGGMLALETGIAQHPRLLARLESLNFKNCESLKDLSPRPRFLLARA